MIDKDEVVRATVEYGGTWGINHTRRILRLVEYLSSGEAYDAEVVFIAAHLHDWGAYKPWKEAGRDHVQRSVEVAGPWLSERGYPEDLRAQVLECIAQHASPGLDRDVSREAMLLHDADVLDFLGAVGILRDFSKSPRDLRAGYEAALKRRRDLPQTLFLEQSSEAARLRLQEMDAFLAAFEAGSFGYF